MNPRARREQLIVHELPDETLVYDLERHTAHCLNRTAAIVWLHCDGRTTTGELAAILHAELGVPRDERLVWFALDRLSRARLLSARAKPPARVGRCSRRQVLKRLGVVAAASIVLPTVMTIVAPRAEAQGSCLPSGTPCSPFTLPCCFPFVCITGTCL